MISESDKQLVAKIVYVMEEDGCVDAMYDWYKMYHMDEDRTVVDLKKMVRGEIFDEIACNVTWEFTTDPDQVLDEEGFNYLTAQLDKSFQKVFPKFVRKIIH